MVYVWSNKVLLYQYQKSSYVFNAYLGNGILFHYYRTISTGLPDNISKKTRARCPVFSVIFNTFIYSVIQKLFIKVSINIYFFRVCVHSHVLYINKSHNSYTIFRFGLNALFLQIILFTLNLSFRSFFFNKINLNYLAMFNINSYT